MTSDWKKHCGPNFSSAMAEVLAAIRDNGADFKPNAASLKALVSRSLVDADGVITEIGRDVLTYSMYASRYPEK